MKINALEIIITSQIRLTSKKHNLNRTLK